MEDLTSIKVGRVARSTERALGISLTGEVAIYVEEEALNRIADRRPKTYLSFVEEIGNILRNPDFVSFDPSREEFTYLKYYFQQKAFTQVYVTVGRKGTPARWFISRIYNGTRTPPPTHLTGARFVRPMNKKVSENQSAS